MEFLTSEQIDILIEEIKARTKQVVYSITIQSDKVPGIFDSKFGGMPYWNIDKEYPADENGNKLMLLAQINFDKAETDSRLPQSGMLQFFIGMDDVFGLDFDNPDKQNTFRVVYHEKINYAVTEEQLTVMDLPVSTNEGMDEYTPVLKEVAVEITKSENYMGCCDYRFEKVVNEIIKEKFGIDYNEEYDSLWSYLGDDDYEEVAEAVSSTGHRMLGYPFFTQSDPREYNDDYKCYDTLLFQMDSDYENSDEDSVLWGDCGVGNFFINHKDLENKDFSKVLYNWDCY
ncbi:MAG: YwqG family protein [Acutalibacteraceae bacterium]|nr:YwqG family protein [Acutalibacteraceae bacterium]